MNGSEPIPYFKFVISEWQNGRISSQPLLNRAVLLEIMLGALSKGGWLPFSEIDREDFAEKHRLSIDEFDAIVRSLEKRGLLLIEGEQVSTKFVLETATVVCELREKRRNAGSKGGKRKASAKQKLASAKQKPSNASNTNTSSNTSSNTGTDGLFEDFWKQYPRKEGKQAASKAFEKAIKAVGGAKNHPVIFSGLLTSPRLKREKQYIPHASTWLNDGGWMDEPEAEEKKRVY